MRGFLLNTTSWFLTLITFKIYHDVMTGEAHRLRLLLNKRLITLEHFPRVSVIRSSLQAELLNIAPRDLNKDNAPSPRIFIKNADRAA